MNFTGISSLVDFYNVIKQIAAECSIVTLSEYTQSKAAINDSIYGRYFYYTNKNNENVYFWIGIYLQETTNIFFKIDHYTNINWCPKKEAEIIKKLNGGKYFNKTMVEGDILWIPLKEKYFEKLCSDIEVDEQKNIIKEFLEEILTKL
jgi:hypothetical protein